MNEPDDKKDNARRDKNAGAGLAIGMVLGIAVGAANDNIGAGVAIGIAMGVALGAMMRSRGAGKEPDHKASTDTDPDAR